MDSAIERVADGSHEVEGEDLSRSESRLGALDPKLTGQPNCSSFVLESAAVAGAMEAMGILEWFLNKFENERPRTQNVEWY